MGAGTWPSWVSAATDRGKVRPKNEDAYRVDVECRLFAVADGMGGHRAGEVASALAIESLDCATLQQFDPKTALVKMVEGANHRIREAAAATAQRHGMGTTLTVAHVGPEVVTVAHVGDSRAYLIGENFVRQLTRDHSIAGELVESGQIDPEAARRHPQRHVLTQALGSHTHVRVEVQQVPVNMARYLLLCTDGLTEVLREGEIAQTVTGAATVASAVETLVRTACDRGGPDNVTVVLIDLPQASAAARAAPNVPRVAGEGN